MLGQGTYGCAFTPPLLCKAYKQKKHGSVGKLTLNEEANHEIKIANFLRKVPLSRNYFLLPDPESCEPAPLSAQKDKEIPKCESLMEDPNHQAKWKDMRQLFLPFGGKNAIGSMILSSNIHPKYFSFFDAMIHILEAGSVLLTSGICHYDLHPNNFLRDNYGVIRILDFGQAFDARTINTETLYERWKMLFFGNEPNAPNPLVTNAEAPEITIINATRNGFPLQDAIQKVVKGKRVFEDMEKTLELSQTQSEKELQAFFSKSLSAQEHQWVEFWKLYWAGFDAWSIGTLLLTILKYQLTWSEFVQGDWQNKGTMAKMALRGLLHPNPHKRLDCVEALFIVDPNNQWIRRFGKPWLEKRQDIRKRAAKN